MYFYQVHQIIKRKLLLIPNWSRKPKRQIETLYCKASLIPKMEKANLNRHFFRDTQMASKDTNRGSTSLATAVCRLVAKSYPALCNPMGCSPPGSSVQEFSRQEHWSGCHFLLQGIFLTQGLNQCRLCILHWQANSLLLNHQESPLNSTTLNILKTNE